MAPLIALALCAGLIAVAFTIERRRRVAVTGALILPLLWYVICASRPASVWLGILGLPGGGTSYTEGATLDGLVFLTLTVLGLFVLARRPFSWGRTAVANIWLVGLFGFMLLSLVWSDFPYVSAKRLLKSAGAVVMVAVVLSEPRPFDAVLAVLRRTAYILVPLSIVLIKYFREIGVGWNWEGSAVSWVGVASSKNNLGQLAVISAVCFLVHLEHSKRAGTTHPLDYVYLGLCVYLLKGSDDAISMTSFSVFVLALVALWGLRCRGDACRGASNFAVWGFLAVSSVVLLVVGHGISPFSEGSLLGEIIFAMGRDLTLTGRTEIWADIFVVAQGHSMFGVGYGAFWIERLANIPWTENLTWTLGQGHNGYIDTYLQLGVLGVLLLSGVIIDGFRKLGVTRQTSPEFWRLRVVLFLVILFTNATETTFLRGEHAFWVLFMLAILHVPQMVQEPSRSATIQKAGFSRPVRERGDV